MLIIKDVIKKYRDRTILHNINLVMNSGSIAILLGKSGVGKSTLLRILNNLDAMDSGSITLDGVHYTDSSHHSFGMVFQHFNLFDHLTVERNITLALEKVLHHSARNAQHIAHELLQKYGLLDKASTYVSQLSGGQKQRLAIARSLALKPKVICMDEPTSALDPSLTNYVAQSIQELALQGFIVLVASHDIALLEKLSGTIYLMENGAIVESALSKDFLNDKQHYPRIAQFVSGAS